MFIDLTPRPTAENSTNPFDRPLFEKAHPLLTPTRANFAQYFNDPDPPTPRTASPTFTRALPSTAISLHAPIFKLMQAPQPKQPDLQAPPAKDRNCALGRLSVHLVSARNLACQSDSAPYAVAQFEQNEWVSGEPQEETDKDRLWKVNHSPVWKQDVSLCVFHDSSCMHYWLTFSLLSPVMSHLMLPHRRLSLSPSTIALTTSITAAS